MDLNPKPKAGPNRPFYKPPENKATSSQIINEARSSLRTLGTKRPFTPRDEQRHLFPSSSSRNPESRPPSSFSLGSRHFDGPDSRPVSGTRLSPLDHAPRTPTAADLENILPPKPPASDPSRPQARRGANARHRIHNQHSAEGYTNKESGPTPHRSESLTDVSGGGGGESGAGEQQVPRAHSGPKERTPALSPEEGGIGDAKDLTRRLSASVSSPPHSAGSRGSREGTDSRVSSGGSRRSSAGQSRGGSAGRKEGEESEEFFAQQVAPLLDQMAALNKKTECEKMLGLAGDLYNLLEDHNCLGKHWRQRSTVLKVIFRLLDVEDTKLLLKLARLILALKVGGNNLLNVCKLVFKVSRNEKNDPLFLEENILNLLLDTIRSTDHVTSCEALIYCVGAVKFLTGNSDILKRLARLDCVKVLATLLHNINKTNKENGKVGDQFGHILVQLAAGLRNLADTSSGRERFIAHHVIEGLTVLMESYPGDSDLMLYISRILSKVTLHTDCCSVLADQHSSYKAFVQLLNRHLKKDDLVVRLCFVLGNVTAKNEQARQRLYQEKEGLDTLLTVLKTYDELDKQGKEFANMSASPEESESTKDAINKIEDVLIKVIRVLANLSISEDVGPFIAANQQLMTQLLSIIDRKDVGESEELILNCVATVNNLTFYTTKQTSLVQQHVAIAESLLKLMLPDKMESMLEAARVFGNLTRHKPVRNFLSKQKVDAMMVTLLDSGFREVVFIACGVLINFMVDEETRPLLKREGGVKKCVEVLRDFGREDWQLSAIVCKMLCNYSARMTSTTDCFGQPEAAQLSDLLFEYLDRDSALSSVLGEGAGGEEDGEMQEYITETWENEFCPVATQLLRRMEAHASPLEPLEAPG
ncbi:armadillo repeat-containing protein 2-like isoform X2 [Babylonia areolata]|uniref:armadillo repeat-containing protein 2-like isoform X2 n=1 Tax=Babylonia areolata TaxID=304850 RepID=UPI003FD3030D